MPEPDDDFHIVQSTGGPIDPAYSRNRKPPALAGGVFTASGANLPYSSHASFVKNFMIYKNTMAIKDCDLEVGGLPPIPDGPCSEREIQKFWRSVNDVPLVSVICHTYNHAGTIEHALNGMLIQKTDFPFEIIVHDDASQDGTQGIIKKYEKNYPSIIKSIFQTDNQFSQGNKPPQFTFPIAKGEYIALCEGDDYWVDDTKLAKQAEFLEENDEFSVCGHDAFTFEANKVVSLSKLAQRHQADATMDELQRGRLVLTLTAMFRNVIEAAPEELSLILNGDAFLFARLGKHGCYKYIPDVLPAGYRIHEGGVWSKLGHFSRKTTHVNSFFGMSQYFRRQGDVQLAEFYAGRSTRIMLDNLDVFEFGFLLRLIAHLVKIFLRKRFPFLIAFKKRLGS